MRKILIILFTINCFYAYSQSHNQINSFYETAMIDYIEGLEYYINEGILDIDLTNIYIVSEDVPIDNLPTEINNYKLNYLNIYSNKNRRLLKKGIYAVYIKPLEIVKNRIKITIYRTNIKLTNKEYTFSIGGLKTFIFSYDCEKNIWVTDDGNGSN